MVPGPLAADPESKGCREIGPGQVPATGETLEGPELEAKNNKRSNTCRWMRHKAALPAECRAKHPPERESRNNWPPFLTLPCPGNSGKQTRQEAHTTKAVWKCIGLRETGLGTLPACALLGPSNLSLTDRSESGNSRSRRKHNCRHKTAGQLKRIGPRTPYAPNPVSSKF